MAERLSRQELYDLVWSEPMKTLAARIGISDVAFKKACAKADVPTPQRGYWAKKEAGKKTFKPTLPPRAPGMEDELLVGGGGNGGYWYGGWSEAELLGPIPSPPEFPEPLESVRERIVKAVGNVSVPREVSIWNPAVNRLLQDDEERRRKQLASRYPMPWEAPRFDAPLEQRRLHILNTLFIATGRMNGKATIDRREGREIDISFHGKTVHLSLDRPGAPKPDRQGSIWKPSTSTDKRLRLAILPGYGSKEDRRAWQDSEGARIEAKIAEIAVEVVLTAEIQYREGALRQHEWRIERRAELEERNRQRRIAEERAERERLERLEQARIDRLSGQNTLRYWMKPEQSATLS